MINTPGIGPLFGHGSFSIENWAFTGNDPKHVTGVPANIATVFNDNAGFYNPMAMDTTSSGRQTVFL